MAIEFMKIDQAAKVKIRLLRSMVVCQGVIGAVGDVVEVPGRYAYEHVVRGYAEQYVEPTKPVVRAGEPEKPVEPLTEAAASASASPPEKKGKGK